jgi:prolyl-tRNA synthetase
MKDLYSFDVTEEEAMKTYDEVRKAYARILDRIGIPYASVSCCDVLHQE